MPVWCAVFAERYSIQIGSLHRTHNERKSLPKKLTPTETQKQACQLLKKHNNAWASQPIRDDAECRGRSKYYAQILISPSQLAEATASPAGLTATDDTLRSCTCVN